MYAESTGNETNLGLSCTRVTIFSSRFLPWFLPCHAMPYGTVPDRAMPYRTVPYHNTRSQKSEAVDNRMQQCCLGIVNLTEGSTILFNIVDKQEQCCLNNIVASCFQQSVTTHNFLPCTITYMEYAFHIIYLA